MFKVHGNQRMEEEPVKSTNDGEADKWDETCPLTSSMKTEV